MKKGDIMEGIVQSLEFPNRGKVKAFTPEGEEVTVKVKNVLPGQKISFRLTKKKNGNLEGNCLEVLEKSPNECEPDCPHFSVCGGCAYRNLPYKEQVKLKEGQVLKLLSPVLADADYSIGSVYEGVFESPEIEGYRNKMEFSFGDEYLDGPLSLGLHKRGSMYDIVPVTECRIIDEDYRRILSFTLRFFRERGVTYFHRVRHTGYLRHLLVRKSKKYGEILIALVTTSQIAYNDGFECRTEESVLNDFTDGLKALKLSGTIQGITHTVNDSVADTVINERTDILYGEAFIHEELLGLKFNISQFSFFQTNSLGAEVLYGKVREFLLGVNKEPGKDCITQTEQIIAYNTEDALNTFRKAGTIYDLYSGTGTIAQLLAPVADEVVGVEIVEEAVEAAKENAALNGLSNCRFIAGDVLKVLDDLHEKPEYIILDPPRDGIHPKALPKILSYGVRRIVYVSCKPTSLARDLVEIMKAGYRPSRICMVDMFPGTNHCEVVTLFERLVD
ncbi:MAG: class I SAM-dependent RNA methyltransferase [Lachnospiraceae bacterium]|nr:class I SAM-dependent RNA methyltransferase [Lachnospiraceae bacterium]